MSWRGAIITMCCAVLVAAGAAVAVGSTFGLPWQVTESSAGPLAVTPDTPAPAVPAAGGEVLTASAGGSGAGGALSDALSGPVGAAGLGDGVGVSVVDPATGETVYESGSDVARTPASTMKILTGAAALHVLGPQHTFTTRVVTGRAGLSPGTARITLVGGGDPTLTTSDSSGGTSLAELAERTAAALDEAGVDAVELAHDSSLFTGPAVDPDWRPSYVASDIVSPVTALGVDVAETRPDDPPAAAAASFADLLDEHGVDVATMIGETDAGDDASEVAAVRSAPLAGIVEEVLTTSDNDGAEVLARHVAVGSGLPGTAADAETAVTGALDELGIDTTAADVRDGSGLARGSAVPADAVAAALALATDPAHPELRPVVTGLPVAGFTGTLADRFDESAGAGLVRAKTGTLTGVSALAGIATTAGGATFVFAVLADEVSSTLAARAALDDVAAAIAACACG
ncbi:D-alanyl-D-alanine carboxypeptidase/D-alanyl-D-alanine-endopeptidase (penicillin-binding protein 4) [Haloactinopolyspora alba]|uniref:D-alanyl-D-alanine carboxypeptidase/D-alanyl-D-alanine-endopeptidase (Penicillin-binding protein 4) n=1 Tax=Haloactinopolyspora alba TaxID=648780 RepID=A0A2P8EFP7_9ACTN|nr:D-alanyl-D-alanine carboxypeptidase/D-alanyl-D-alanine-endopeptidase [Haloactinopolyspora alba]PSL08296.1 D-alanyl-D-alanine carboxypeptidase/D-alanyl-D-alanine-endopeptidase (penicillin-binding protein 4) [Haloactinopolyspora alba]